MVLLSFLCSLDGERRRARSFQNRPAGPGSPPAPARAARLAKSKREQLVVDYLIRGVSVAEIAARIGVGEKRMRANIREILARRTRPGSPLRSR
jgi:DNA-binding NarL/FixJ family response regulator